MKYIVFILMFTVLSTISIVVLLLLPDEPSYWFVLKVCFVLIIVWLAMLLFKYEETSLVGREALGDTSEASDEPSKYTTTRLLAMKWWNTIPTNNNYPFIDKKELTKVYYPNRRVESLTGAEIQHIFERELSR